MSRRTTFRPDAVEVEEKPLRQFRSHAELLDVNRRRLYGLAIEFAVANEEQFRDFADDADDSQ